MRIRVLFLPIAMLGCLLFACQQSDTAAQPKFAVVDLARVMRDSEPGKAGVKFLEGLQADMQNKLNDIQKKLEANPKGEAAQKEMQSVYMSAQQRMQAEQQNVVNVLYDTIQRVMNAYRAEKGYAVILGSEAAVSFDSKVDVTNDVLEAVNRQKVEFKPMTPEADRKEDAAAPANAPEKDAAGKDAAKSGGKDEAKKDEAGADSKDEAKGGKK